MKQFSSINTKQLKVADLYSLSKSTIDYALPVKDSMGDLLKATFTQLETDNTAMGASLHKPLKSGITPLLKMKRDDRKNHFAEVKRNIQTSSKSLDQTKKTAGETLKIFMEPYWDTDKKAMNTATVVIKEMIEKYRADEELVTHAAAIGIIDMINGLDTVNNEFASLYMARNSQQAANEGPTPSSLKIPLTKSYEKFCDVMEQAINYVPSPTLLALFGQMDELRGKYALLIGKTDKGGDTPGEPQAE